MARYCDPSDLGRYGVNAAALADLSIEVQIDPAINWASDKIDSFLRAKYTLPLVDWGTDIRGCCAILAVWRAITVRGRRPGEDGRTPLDDDKDDQLKWLAQIAGGTVHPEVTDSSSGATAGGSPDRPFVASNEQRGYYTDGSRAEPFQGRRQ